MRIFFFNSIFNEQRIASVFELRVRVRRSDTAVSNRHPQGKDYPSCFPSPPNRLFCVKVSLSVFVLSPVIPLCLRTARISAGGGGITLVFLARHLPLVIRVAAAAAAFALSSGENGYLPGRKRRKEKNRPNLKPNLCTPMSVLALFWLFQSLYYGVLYTSNRTMRFLVTALCTFNAVVQQ